MEMGGYLVITLTIWIWIICFTRINSVFAAQRETPKTKDISSIFHSNVGANKNFINIDEQINGPYFDRAASKNVSALLGKTAYLNCRVKNLGNKTNLIQVSWVRHRDVHLLTVGRYTYTSDQRFRAIHHPHTEDWILQIKYPQHRDSGIYECQISTTPHMSHYIHLNVIEPSTDIIGGPDMYIEAGSTINLTCVVKNSPEPPAYIYWNHNNVIISYDSPRGGVSVVTDKGKITKSSLLITNAKTSDSGQYQCNPSNSKSKTVNAHVLNGEIPEAMQRAGQTKTFFFLKNYYFHIYVLIMFYINFNLRKFITFSLNLFLLLLKKFFNFLLMMVLWSSESLKIKLLSFAIVSSSHLLSPKPIILIHKYNYR